MSATNETNRTTETVNGVYGPITFFSSDRVIGTALRRYGEWAENEIRFLANFISEGGTVLDIGSFIGTHALAFSHRVGPTGTVHCFEPQPAAFELLVANVTANGCDQAILHRAVLGEIAGQSTLEPRAIGSATNAGGPGISDTNAEWAGAGLGDVETIDALGLAACDLIKCHGEGVEQAVLRGGATTIRALRPVIYCPASSLDGAVKATQIFWQLGYRVYVLIVDPFNPANFFASPQNIFGDAREIGLVGLMPEQEEKLEDLSSSCWEIHPVETLDDLAYAMLHKAHSVDDVLRARRAAAMGGSVVSAPHHRSTLNELDTAPRQVEALQDQLRRLRSELHESLARSRSEAEELSALRRQVPGLRRQLQASEQKAEQLSRDLRRLRRSNVFRVFRTLIDTEMNVRDRLKQRRATRAPVPAEDAGDEAVAGVSEALSSAPAAHPITLVTVGRGVVPVDMPPVEAPTLLMVASADAMNGKGLRDFIRFAWPIIREAVPEAELCVAGAVGQELSGHEPGVTALGCVADVTPLYLRSRVVINPAVAGTDVKIKTLEALNHLRPIVLWPSGREGLHPDLARHCVCVEDWFQYAEAVIELLKNSDLADEIQASRDQIRDLLSEDVN
ncbi:FkbM family methyltransferase [Ancylobacter sp. WKF20]|uniref:FkbM family methyltransferase n=1 Tax=Ancylobacter sp. WKF20 TaxID=3039801 RepID=UPI00243423D2|nr:FkbM family methyltransferase [Ancylobacter sp. WKF20]WGD32222.1 FkbM family methyltransferase [Ancylobacter sp. WKF20]